MTMVKKEQGQDDYFRVNQQNMTSHIISQHKSSPLIISSTYNTIFALHK